VAALKQGSHCNPDGRKPDLDQRDLVLRRLFAAIHIAGDDDANCLHPTRYIANTVEPTFGEHIFISVIAMI
jgi:hypothetical protein